MDAIIFIISFGISVLLVGGILIIRIRKNPSYGGIYLRYKTLIKSLLSTYPRAHIRKLNSEFIRLSLPDSGLAACIEISRSEGMLNISSVNAFGGEELDSRVWQFPEGMNQKKIAKQILPELRIDQQQQEELQLGSAGKTLARVKNIRQKIQISHNPEPKWREA